MERKVGVGVTIMKRKRRRQGQAYLLWGLVVIGLMLALGRVGWIMTTMVPQDAHPADGNNIIDQPPPLMVMDHPQTSLSIILNIPPRPHIPTLALANPSLHQGLCNQFMAVVELFHLASSSSNKQDILLDRLMHLDNGSQKRIRHQELFDVVHWNNHTSRILPRLVSCSPTIHVDYDCANQTWKEYGNQKNPKQQQQRINPQKSPKQTKLFALYKKKPPNNIERILWQTHAWKPAPLLQRLIQQYKDQYFPGTKTTYMTIHARIEPDMQKHKYCLDKKVLRLQDILNQVYKIYPTPPVDKVLIPINRAILERSLIQGNNTNKIALENLKLLNQLQQTGMWNGSIPVLELGSTALVGTPLESRKGTFGAALNFWMALDATIFVGTPVSTFSTLVMRGRFFQNPKSINWQYLPSGMQAWTTSATLHPPGFNC